MSGEHVPDVDPNLLVIARPKASKASRLIQMRSTASFRGCRVSLADDREVFRESTVEDGLALIFDTNRGVKRTEEQLPPVIFLDDDGRYHRHTFDFRVTLRCGTRVAYAVKAWRRVEPTRIRRKLELIEQQVGTRFADEYVLVTERDIPRSRVFNATLISHSRLVRDERQVVELATFAARLRGTLPIANLLEASGLGVDGFVSAVCLLDEGMLSQVSPGRIGLETQVRTVHHNH